MDKEQAIVLAKRYKEMVAERLPLKALYLYGSYSKGNYREDSDIDIAVVVEHLDDNYFEDTMKAGHYENRKESDVCSSRSVSLPMELMGSAPVVHIGTISRSTSSLE